METLLLLVVANGAPVLASLLLGSRGARPVDGGRRWADGRRLLGLHKTWRGLASGVLAAAAMGSILEAGIAVGAAFGALALTGDLASSFAKRRRDLPAGRESVLLDSLPESLLPLLVLRRPLGLDATGLAATTVAFVVLDVIASRALGALRSRRR